MPLIHDFHESLPYIDADVPESEHARINKLIASELSSDARTTLHPSILPEPTFRPSPLIQQELDRIGAQQPRVGGIDLSRYEAPEAPSSTDDLEAWQITLQRAYASSTYLSGRVSNLSLLEELGKNAWLIGNSQLEEILRQMERELEGLKSETEKVNRSRKAAQEGSQGELVALEQSWRGGIGKILEVEVAMEELRQQILQKRRQHVR